MATVTYNVSTPIIGESFKKIDLEAMRAHAPTVRQTDHFADGSINVTVAERESDDLTDYLDSLKLEYRMI